MKSRNSIKVALLLAIVTICLCAFVLRCQSNNFHEFETALLQTQGMLLVCLAIWCSTFLFPTFSINDLPLLGLLVIAVAMYCVGYTATWQMSDHITLLFGATLGKGFRFALKSGKQKVDSGTAYEIGNRKSEIRIFLVGLVGLQAFASWWHLHLANNNYLGPRWMGLLNSPNDYGMLMGAGVTLTIGLLAERLKAKGQRLKEERTENLKSEKLKVEMERRKLLQILKAESRKQKLLIGFLLVAALMMGVGLVFSYSRGAWVATAHRFAISGKSV